MPANLISFAVGLALGLSLAAPPGPVNALIARQASRHGLKAALRIGIAAPIVDALYMGLVVFGILALVDVRPIAPAMAAVGAVVMAYFAWATVRVRPPGAEPPSRFWAMVLLSATNPFQLLWWVSAGPTLLAGQGAWGAAGFLTAIFSWVFVFAYLVAHGARRWEWFTPMTAIVSADLLLVFALQLAVTAVGWPG